MALSSVLASIPGVAGYEAGSEAANVNALSRLRTAEGAMNAQKMMEDMQKRRSVLDAVRNANGDYEAMSKGLAGVGDLAGAEHARRLGNEEAISRELPNALNPDGTLDYGKVSVLLARRGNAGAALTAAQHSEGLKEKRTINAQNRQSVLAMAGSPERPSLVDPQEAQQSADQGTPLPPPIPGTPSVVAGWMSDPQMRPHAEAFERMLRSDPNMKPEEVGRHLDRLGNIAKSYSEGDKNRQSRIDEGDKNRQNRLDLRDMINEGLEKRQAEKIAGVMAEPANVRTMRWTIEALTKTTNPATGKPFTEEEATSATLSRQLKMDKGEITPGVVAQIYGVIRRTAEDPKTVNEETKAAVELARQIAGESRPRPRADQPAPRAGTTPPPRAIDFLKKNPSQANKDQFKQYYGVDPDQYLKK